MSQERHSGLEKIAMLLALILLLWGCGGGANNQDAAVSLTINEITSLDGEDEGDLVEIEMVKDVSTTSVMAQVGVIKLLGTDVSQTVGTVNLKSYRMTFKRKDGGTPTLPVSEGQLSKQLSYANTTNAPSSARVEIPLVTTRDKLYSAFANAFYNDPEAVDFEVELVIQAENLARQNLQATYVFGAQAAIYLPVTDLLPVVVSFDQTTELRTDQEYLASWTVSSSPFPIISGTLTSPWGTTSSLSPDEFPVGAISLDPSVVNRVLDPGDSFTYPSGILFVRNFIGSAVSDSSSSVTISRPEAPPIPVVAPVSINQFVADRYAVVEGQSVQLSWVISGGPTQLGIFPASYSGVRVDFGGKNPAFDSVTITPEFSVHPFLRASRPDGSVDVEFLANPIVVSAVPDVDPTIEPPMIEVFTPSRSSVAQNQQVTLFWSLSGDIKKVELFPINNQPLEVTGRSYLLTPPHLNVGTQNYTLVVEGVDGSTVTATTSVTVVQNLNQAISILNVSQHPGNAISNGDQGSFSFRVSDPERADSSWQVDKIAGDSASFFPRSGQIPRGLGDVAVAFQDHEDNASGYLIFQISAFDDSNYGRTSGSTRAIQLLTFTTDGEVRDNAPEITDVSFTAGDELSTEGVLSFRFSDPDTLDLSWTVSLTSGDLGGTLSPSFGRVTTGSGVVAVNYRDDADTPDAPVTFLITVIENSGNNPQRDLFVYFLDKGAADDGGGTTPPPTSGPIGFVYSGLFADLSGQVTTANEITDFSFFSNGDNTTNPIFYRNSDQSGPISGLSAIFEFNHESRDPSNIRISNYTRNFIEVTSNPDNTGGLTFGGYFGAPRQEGDPSNTTITNGVSRWFMQFGAGAFRNSSASNFNLPTTGSRDYSIQVVTQDADGETITVNKTLRITVAQ